MADQLKDPPTIALCEAIGAELERQHEQTGITEGLVMTRTEEAGVVRLDGRLDLHALTLAVVKHGLGAAYTQLVGYDPFEDDPSQTVEEVRALLTGVAQEHRNAELAQLREAEALIRDLCAHEGAEGWSKDLSDRLDAYQFATAPEGKPIPQAEQTYLYDCDRGQGSVTATNLEQAKRRAQREAGSLAQVRNVHLATVEELTVRSAMGG